MESPVGCATAAKQILAVKGPARRARVPPIHKKISRSVEADPEGTPKPASSTGLGLSRFHAIAAAERGAEIVAALLRFGFGEFARQTGLSRHHDKRAKHSGQDAAETIPVRVRLLLQCLGPTFVKIGQIMSTRPDLIPQDWRSKFMNHERLIPLDFSLCFVPLNTNFKLKDMFPLEPLS